MMPLMNIASMLIRKIKCLALYKCTAPEPSLNLPRQLAGRLANSRNPPPSFLTDVRKGGEAQ
jgi:hypothetical protein